MRQAVSALAGQNVAILICEHGEELADSLRTRGFEAYGCNGQIDTGALSEVDGFAAVLSFAREAERAAFRLLQTVQGVGAKAALSILTVLEPDQLAQAILAGDKAMVARADGIGPKLAQRIVNELAQKTGALASASLASGQMGQGIGEAAQNSGQNAVMQDALSALVNLGYSRTEAFTALQKSQEGADGSDISGLIAAALKELGR